MRAHDDTTADAKRCPRCKETKPRNQFAKDRNRKDGQQTWCMPCSRAANRQSYNKYPEKYRFRYFRATYGLTPDSYDALMEAQGGVCTICGGLNPIRRGMFRRLVIDHDHATGRMRGLLCDWCNQGLGRFKDRPDLLRRAADYLERDA